MTLHMHGVLHYIDFLVYAQTKTLGLCYFP